MKIHIAGLTVMALMAGAATAANAQQSAAPGQMMHEKGSVKGTTGASGYAPGHEMHKKGSVKGTVGASGYAPGHTGATVNTNAHVGTGKSGIDASGSVKGSTR